MNWFDNLVTRTYKIFNKVKKYNPTERCSQLRQPYLRRESKRQIFSNESSKFNNYWMGATRFSLPARN